MSVHTVAALSLWISQCILCYFEGKTIGGCQHTRWFYSVATTDLAVSPRTGTLLDKKYLFCVCVITGCHNEAVALVRQRHRLRSSFIKTFWCRRRGQKTRIIIPQLMCLVHFFPKKPLAISLRAMSGKTNRRNWWSNCFCGRFTSLR